MRSQEEYVLRTVEERGIRFVQLWFTEGLEPAFCRVSVTGPPGFHGAGPAKPVAGDPRSLALDLGAPVPPGTYVVRWRVLSADTHVTEGDFSFRVGL